MNLITKTFEGNNIRLTKINDNIYFVGKDVAEALGYVNTNQAISVNVWDEYKGGLNIDTLGGTQKMVCINEQGVYQLVFASNKPEARSFQRWVIEDVLPSIRQTGETFASVSGYARMVGKDKSTISRRLHKSCTEGVPETGEVLTAGGLQRVALIDEDLICEWLPQDSPNLATAVMKLGVRKLLHKLAGYNFQPQPQLPTPEEDLKLAFQIGELIEAKFDNKSVGKQLALKAYSVAVPSKYLSVLEEAKTKLSEEGAIDSNDLWTPSNIANELYERGLVEYNSARKVNALLEDLQLQTKSKKNWKATNKARKLDLCSEVQITAPVSQTNNTWSGTQLKWKTSVIDYIISSLEDDDYYELLAS